jgi:hypothetical protein
MKKILTAALAAAVLAAMVVLAGPGMAQFDPGKQLDPKKAPAGSNIKNLPQGTGPAKLPAYNQPQKRPDTKSAVTVSKPAESPARKACVDKCRAAHEKSNLSCKRLPDNVEIGSCQMQASRVFDGCMKKCPAK